MVLIEAEYLYLTLIDSRSGTDSPANCSSLKYKIKHLKNFLSKHMCLSQHCVQQSQNIYNRNTRTHKHTVNPVNLQFWQHNLFKKVSANFDHMDLILPRTCPITSDSCANFIFSSSGITLQPVSIWLMLHSTRMILVFLYLLYCVVCNYPAMTKELDHLPAQLCTTSQEK